MCKFLSVLRSIQSTYTQHDYHVESLTVKPDGTYTYRQALKG